MNLLAALHEDGAIVPSWGSYTPPALPAGEGWSIEAPPAGGSSDLGDYVLYWNVNGTTFQSFSGPATKLDDPLPNEFYLSLQVYKVRSSMNGSVLSSQSGSGFLYGYPLNPDGTRASNPTLKLTMGSTGLGVIIGSAVDLGSTGTNRATVVGSPLPFDTWVQYDIRIQYNPIILSIKKDCGAYVDSADNGETFLSAVSPPQDFQLKGGPQCTEEAYLDNFVINNTAGSFNNNDVCLSGLPGTTFTSDIFSETEIEIELPEFRPPPLMLPRRGEFDKYPEDNHRANLRALEYWASQMNDTQAYIWPEEWVEQEEEPTPMGWGEEENPTPEQGY